MNDIRESLRALYNEGRSFDGRDPLVNLERNESRLFRSDCFSEELDLAIFPSRIIADARSLIKESGSNPLCSTNLVVRINANQSFPLFLIPVSFSVHTIKKKISFSAEDEIMVNPYLSVFLEKEGISIPDQLQSFFFSTQISEEEQTLLIGFLKTSGLETEFVGSILGNFHPHRYSYLKDIDHLLKQKPGSSLNELLTGESLEDFTLDLTTKNLFPTDNDQEEVIDSIHTKNIAVLGPPGTGKSQFLTNFIGKALYSRHSILAVSEKRTALEVIQKRLSERELGRLCFIYSGANDNRKFVAQLKENWKAMESLVIKSPVNPERSSSLLNNLQFTLDILKSPNIIGGLSLEDFFSMYPEKSRSEHYLPTPPSFIEIHGQKESIRRYYAQNGQHVFRHISKKTVSDNSFSTYLKELHELSRDLNSLQLLLPVANQKELDHSILLMSYAQVTQNDFFKAHTRIFIPESKQQKSFLRLAKKHSKISREIDKNDSYQHWKYVPNTIELEALQGELNTNKGWTWKKKKQWNKLSNAPFSAAQGLIKDELKFRAIQTESQSIQDELTALGVDITEIPLMLQWIQRYNAEEWKQIHSLSSELSSYSGNIHADLDHLSKQLRKLLTIQPEEAFRTAIDAIQDRTSELSDLWSAVRDWSEELFASALEANAYEDLEEMVIHSNWLNFSSRYPGLSHFQPSLLKEKIEEIIKEQETEFELFGTEIQLVQKSAFEELEMLLQTPARKLSENEKSQKAHLRKGKSILAKEFSKKTRHLSFYSLFNSEARPWIQALIPVLMCNTDEVANCFPPEEDLFDIVVFDEASQIPLFAAVGGISRSKRLVIAGDDQQMRPMKAFSSRSEEVKDLLTQGLLYIKSGMLKHHYRSYSEKLIAFSNMHFYKDQLIAFPSYPSDPNAIQMIRLQGIYDDRKNKEEAKAIAQRVSELLQANDHFGVVAFSEEQTNLIWNSLSPADQEKFGEAIESNRSFLKPVEKVQGDECDILLISFTFGKNPEGKFKYTFGPMSTAHGTNRLNVLLTRARKKIEFYTTVNHNDFRITSNESVELIRKWFLFIEKNQEEKTTHFPFDLQPEVIGNVLKIRSTSKYISNATELCTLHAVLSSRGWNVNYV